MPTRRKIPEYEEVRRDFYARLRHVMEQRQLGVVEVERKARLSPGTLKVMARGKRAVELHTVTALANALGVAPGALLVGTLVPVPVDEETLEARLAFDLAEAYYNSTAMGQVERTRKRLAVDADVLAGLLADLLSLPPPEFQAVVALAQARASYLRPEEQRLRHLIVGTLGAFKVDPNGQRLLAAKRREEDLRAKRDELKTEVEGLRAALKKRPSGAL